MFVNMGFGEPADGREADCEASMRAFAQWLRPAPGCLGIRLLREPSTGILLGVSFWTDEASFRAGMARPRDAAARAKGDPAMWAQPPSTREWAELASW